MPRMSIENDREATNWVRHWLPDDFQRHRDFFGTPTGKPVTDLSDPPWSSALSGGLVGCDIVLQDQRVVLVPFMDNPILHAAWLCSWPVRDNGEAAPNREIWQPDSLNVIVDFMHRRLLLQQSWRNPRQLLTVVLKDWKVNDASWQQITRAFHKKWLFHMLVPNSLSSHDRVLRSRYERLSGRLTMIYWKIQRIGSHGQAEKNASEAAMHAQDAKDAARDSRRADKPAATAQDQKGITRTLH